MVILNWNGKALMEQFLPSVIRYSEEATIYIADNASTDDSVPFVYNNFPGIRIIRNKFNAGFAGGYNEALANLHEEILILLNSDVEVSPGWLLPIQQEFENDPMTGAVQPKILNFRKKDFFEYAGAAGGYLDRFGYPYCRGRIFEHLEEDLGQYDNTQSIFWASGACLAIRKDAFQQAGRFDEDFFAHQEEIDLCWRLNNLGWKIKAAGKSRVFHLGGGTLDQAHPKKTFYNFRNNLYTLLKNVPTWDLMWLLPSRLILDGIAGIKFLLEGRAKHTLAIIKAHFSFYLNFSTMRRKRKKPAVKRKYFHKTSVLYACYILGRKKFEAL